MQVNRENPNPTREVLISRRQLRHAKGAHTTAVRRRPQRPHGAAVFAPPDRQVSPWPRREAHSTGERGRDSALPNGRGASEKRCVTADRSWRGTTLLGT